MTLSRLSKLLFSHWTKNELWTLQAALQTAQRVWKKQEAQPNLSPSLQRVYRCYAVVVCRLLCAVGREMKARADAERANPNPNPNAKPKNYDRP
jgi:hypothetical protein